MTGRPDTRQPTLRDVAKRARVSPMTVSRVLSGDRPVSAARRQLVLQAMDELHYRPNRTAQALATGEVGGRLVFVLDGGDLAMLEALATTGVQQAQRGGMRIGVHRFAGDASLAEQARRIAECGTVGAVLVPGVGESGLAAELQRLDLAITGLAGHTERAGDRIVEAIRAIRHLLAEKRRANPESVRRPHRIEPGRPPNTRSNLEISAL